MSKKNLKTEDGYTIIETMIAVSLFIIIVMSGMGALLNANLIHRKSRDMRSIIDSLSFVMEDMSRNIRTGYNYRCISANSDFASANIATPRSNPTCWGIAFESQNGSTTTTSDQWLYYYGSTSNGNTGIFKSVDGGTTLVQLTSSEVAIDPSATNI